MTIRAVLITLVLATSVTSAPTPYRLLLPPPPLGLVGEWGIHWQGGVGQARFHSRGGYECVWCGQQWIGHWSVEDGILTVVEAIRPHQPGTLPNWYTWKAALDLDGRGGRLPSGGTFKLKAGPRPELKLPRKPELLRMPKGSP